MNTNTTKSTETKHKSAGRPPTVIFPKRGKFTAKGLAEKFNVTVAAVHSRLKKLANAKQVFVAGKDDKATKGRKTTIYTMEDKAPKIEQPETK